MSTYASQTAYAARFDVDEFYADTTDQQTDLDNAEAIIHSHVAQRYAVPVTGSEAMNLLQSFTYDIAIHMAHRRRNPGMIPAGVQAAHDLAMTQLFAIGAGAQSLGDTPPPDARAGRQDGIDTTGEDPEMTREKLKGF